jgi:hypothetical protein
MSAFFRAPSPDRRYRRQTFVLFVPISRTWTRVDEQYPDINMCAYIYSIQIRNSTSLETICVDGYTQIYTGMCL